MKFVYIFLKPGDPSCWIDDYYNTLIIDGNIFFQKKQWMGVFHGFIFDKESEVPLLKYVEYTFLWDHVSKNLKNVLSDRSYIKIQQPGVINSDQLEYLYFDLNNSGLKLGFNEDPDYLVELITESFCFQSEDSKSYCFAFSFPEEAILKL